VRHLEYQMHVDEIIGIVILEMIEQNNVDGLILIHTQMFDLQH
jgi:hypothetical protein